MTQLLFNFRTRENLIYKSLFLPGNILLKDIEANPKISKSRIMASKRDHAEAFTSASMASASNVLITVVDGEKPIVIEVDPKFSQSDAFIQSVSHNLITQPKFELTKTVTGHSGQRSLKFMERNVLRAKWSKSASFVCTRRHLQKLPSSIIFFERKARATKVEINTISLAGKPLESLSTGSIQKNCLQCF